MALTKSNTVWNKLTAPSFELEDTISDKRLKLNDLKGEKGTLILFICNHCPYVIQVIEELVKIADDYSSWISTIAISSNDIEKYPSDAPPLMKEFAAKYQFKFPYLFDESQEVAKAYDAQCTPDIFLFDQYLKPFYLGRLDESRPGNDIPVDGKDLRKAIDHLLLGKEAPKEQIPGMGCSIKWK